jgi:hypothetical protein
MLSSLHAEDFKAGTGSESANYMDLYPIRIQQFCVNRITSTLDKDYLWLYAKMKTFCEEVGSTVVAIETEQGAVLRVSKSLSQVVPKKMTARSNTRSQMKIETRIEELAQDVNRRSTKKHLKVIISD